MTTGMDHRFVLSIPNMDVCLAAPRNPERLVENPAAIHQGSRAKSLVCRKDLWGGSAKSEATKESKRWRHWGPCLQVRPAAKGAAPKRLMRLERELRCGENQKLPGVPLSDSGLPRYLPAVKAGGHPVDG